MAATACLAMGTPAVTPEDVLRLAREALRAGKHRYHPHFLQQMDRRCARVPDVKRAISTATGAELQPNGSWRLLGGKDTDGDDLVLAIRVDDGLELVTLFDSR